MERHPPPPPSPSQKRKAIAEEDAPITIRIKIVNGIYTIVDPTVVKEPKPTTFVLPPQRCPFDLDIEDRDDDPLIRDFVSKHTVSWIAPLDPYEPPVPTDLSKIRVDRRMPRETDKFSGSFIPGEQTTIYGGWYCFCHCSHCKPTYTGPCYFVHEGGECDCYTATPISTLSITGDPPMTKTCSICPGACIQVTHKDPSEDPFCKIKRYSYYRDVRRAHKCLFKVRRMRKASMMDSMMEST